MSPSRFEFDENGKLKSCATWSDPPAIAYYLRPLLGGKVRFRSEGPEIVYKYTSEEGARFFVEGRLRIRPLRAFRAIEDRDAARGDRNEGTVSTTLHTPRPALDAMIPTGAPPGLIKWMGSNTRNDCSHHVMVLCFSTNPRSARCKDEFGARIVPVRNADPSWLRIAEVVSTALGMMPSWVSAAPVVYAGHDLDAESPEAGKEHWRYKRPDYSWQEEFRLSIVFDSPIPLLEADTTGEYLDVFVSPRRQDRSAGGAM